MVKELREPEALQQLVDRIPQKRPFRFIDGLEFVSEEGCRGFFTFPPTADFYRGHFPNHAVTPGVILGECAAQIGVLPIGMYLRGYQGMERVSVFLTAIDLEFLKPVYPNDRVIVTGTKKYFRKQVIRCSVEMTNSSGEPLVLGEIAAMLTEPWNTKE